MEKKIKNREIVAGHGNRTGRTVVLDIAEQTLQRLDACEQICKMMHLDGDRLSIGEKSWDLSRKRNVYLLGAGKACNHMARAVEKVLGGRLTRGIIIVKSLEEEDQFQYTEVYVGGHPLPNEQGLAACRKIEDLVTQATSKDLFIGVVSGGSSALMSYPVEGLTLQDEIDTTDVMLKSGADIVAVNTIRRHISRMNGGMLARKIADRGAELICIGISDAVGTVPETRPDMPYPDYKGTPFGPDPTTLAQARKILRDYAVEERLPKSVVTYLKTAGEEAETPKKFPQNTYFLLNTLPDSCRIAREIAEKMGYRAMILTSFLEGEAKDAGKMFAALAREIQEYGNPIQPPCVVLSSGEVVTTILDNAGIKGHGGPGQEMTAGFALAAEKTEGCVLLSIDSEGTDGTTPVAGGLVDSRSASAARSMQVDLNGALQGHACYEALKAMGDAVYTGNTGTNLCDLNILFVPEKRRDVRIRAVSARQIIDCKCRPMVEAQVICEDGTEGCGAAPTGSSVGMYESFVLRDGDAGEYHGLSVHHAVAHVNEEISRELAGVSIFDQAEIDRMMIRLDGTKDKHRMGGNAIYSVSVAAYRAAAAAQKMPLYEYISGGNITTIPIPSFNVMNGGNNQGICQAFNEFILMPYRAEDIEQAVEIGIEVFQELGKVIGEYTGRAPMVGGSYGWCAPSEDPEVCLHLILQAVHRCDRDRECALALDCAASEMYSPEEGYYLNGTRIDSAGMVDYVKKLTEKYPFVFIEDMLDENDWEGYALAHQKIHRTLLIGDDLTASNPERIRRAHEEIGLDGFILKPNQIGTITEALEAHRYAKEHGMLSITSGRSGGVVGDVVMDLAVGLQIPFIKNGCPRSGERIDKLNFLLRVKDRYPQSHMARIDDLVRF